MFTLVTECYIVQTKCVNNLALMPQLYTHSLLTITEVSIAHTTKCICAPQSFPEVLHNIIPYIIW